MFVCRVLCCLTFVLNLLIVFVLATNLLPRGRSSSKTLCFGCQTGRRHLSCTNAGIVCLLVAKSQSLIFYCIHIHGLHFGGWGSSRVLGNTQARGVGDPCSLPVSTARLTSPSFARRRRLLN